MNYEIAKASKNLALIEDHVQDYEDEESIAPTPEVFASVREFLKALSDECTGLPIPAPKLFVSPNGHIVVEIGERPYEMIIRFRPEVTFVYWNPRIGDNCVSGEGMTNAVNTLKEVFGLTQKTEEPHWIDPSNAKEKLIAGWEPTTVETPPVLPTCEELFGQKIVIDEEDD